MPGARKTGQVGTGTSAKHLETLIIVEIGRQVLVPVDPTTIFSASRFRVFR